MDSSFLKQLSEITEANFSNPDFGPEMLTRKMGMSHSVLLRKLRSQTGLSINHYIRNFRLDHALELLLTEDLSAAEVAYRTGFNSSTYFNTCFSEHFGYPPGEVKKNRNHGQFSGNQLMVAEGAQEEKIVKGIAEVRKSDLDKKRIVRTAGVAVVILILALAAVIAVTIDRKSKVEKSIAVLPFQCAGEDSQTLSFAGSLQEQLLNDLDSLNVFMVKSRVSTDRYRSSEKNIKEIGREMDVDFVVHGTIVREDKRYNIWIYLEETRTDLTVWSQPYIRNKGVSFGLENEIAQDVARRIFLLLTTQTKRPDDEEMIRNPQAIHYFSQGNYYLNFIENEADEALQNYQKAIGLDSLFVEAQLGISMVLSHLYSRIDERQDTLIERSRTAIDQALTIRPGLPEAMEKLGYYYIQQGNFSEALDQLQALLLKEPDRPEALYYSAMAYLGLGNWNKAEEQIKQVLEIKPNYVQALAKMAEIYEQIRDFAKAEYYYNQALAREPFNSLAISCLSSIPLKTEGNIQKSRERLNALFKRGHPRCDSTRCHNQHLWLDLYEGKYKDALDQISTWAWMTSLQPPYYFRPKPLIQAMIYGWMNHPDLERKYYDSTRLYLEHLRQECYGNLNDPRVISALGIAYAGLGRTIKAVDLAHQAVDKLAEKPDAVIGPYVMEEVAYIYTKIGRYPEAIDILRELLSQPGPLTIHLLRLDPRWLPLKNHPGYKILLRDIPGQ